MPKRYLALLTCYLLESRINEFCQLNQVLHSSTMFLSEAFVTSFEKPLEFAAMTILTLRFFSLY